MNATGIISQSDLDAAAVTMDEAIVETIHASGAPRSPIAFMAAYIAADPEWPADQHLSPAQRKAVEDWYGAASAAVAVAAAATVGVGYERLRDDYADALAAICCGTPEDIIQRMADDGEVYDPDYYINTFGATTNVRDVIVAAQASAGRTGTELSRSVAARCGCNPETVLRYLRGTHDTTTSILGALMDELRLTITER